MANQGAELIQFPVRETSAPSGVTANLTASATTGGGPTPAGHRQAQASTGSTFDRSTQLLTLQNLGNGRVFVHPLYVSVEQSGDEWFATSHDLALIGRGESDLDAIDDLRASIAELFDALSEMRHELGPLMRDQLEFLERLAGVK